MIQQITAELSCFHPLFLTQANFLDEIRFMRSLLVLSQLKNQANTHLSTDKREYLREVTDSMATMVVLPPKGGWKGLECMARMTVMNFAVWVGAVSYKIAVRVWCGWKPLGWWSISIWKWIKNRCKK